MGFEVETRFEVEILGLLNVWEAVELLPLDVLDEVPDDELVPSNAAFICD